MVGRCNVEPEPEPEEAEPTTTSPDFLQDAYVYIDDKPHRLVMREHGGEAWYEWAPVRTPQFRGWMDVEEVA